MSTINGLGGPRLPTLSPTTTQSPVGSSFLSRLGASGSVALPATNGPAVSGKSIISSAVGAATSGQGAPVSDAQKTIQDMSRSFVMGMAQTTFGDIGQCKADIEPEDD